MNETQKKDKNQTKPVQKTAKARKQSQKNRFQLAPFFEKLKTFLVHLFTVNKGIKLLSLFLAVVIWLAVVLTQSTRISGTAVGVPVMMDLTDTAVGKLGLSAISLSEKEVNVSLTGSRESVQSLTRNPETIKVGGQLNKVNAAGTYEIELIATLPASAGEDVSIASVSPATITVRFDTVEQKTIPVTVDYSSVKIEEGLVCMQAEPSFTEITVQGPAADVNKVTKAVAAVTDSSTLSASKEFVVPLVLQDDNGATIDGTYITMEKTEISVVLPVYKTKTVPLKVNFAGSLKEEQLASIPYTLSHNTIEIAGPPDKIDAVSEIVLGSVNLTDLTPGYKTSFDLTLPAGFVSIENVTKVDFTFSAANWTTKTFNVRHFEVLNVPDGTTTKLLTSVIYNVRMVGEKTVLSKLTADDLTAQVDFLDKSLTSGKWNYNVVVKNDTRLVWSVGSYTVTVQVN